MNDAPIGLLGASGSVGREVVRLLRPGHRLRIGGRDPQALQRLAGEPGAVQAQPLDLNDEGALRGFVAGCRLVVNCAGPSYRVLDRVARAALAAGADYLDVGGDDLLWQRLEGQVPEGRRVLLSAGMLPGLSGLLPRYLAAGLQRIDEMRCYAGGLGALSASAAEDFLLSLDPAYGFGRARQAWCDGRAVAWSGAPVEALRRPWSGNRDLLATAYLGAEGQRLFASLGVARGSAFNLFEDGQLLACLRRIQGRGAAESDRAGRVAELVAASRLDAAGRTPYQLLAVELSGCSGGREVQRSAWLRAGDGSRLTAAMAAFAVECLERLPPGLHFAAEVLPPSSCLERLQAWLPELRLGLGEAAAERGQAVEGVL
jgi:hypothetical protein